MRKIPIACICFLTSAIAQGSYAHHYHHSSSESCSSSSRSISKILLFKELQAYLDSQINLQAVQPVDKIHITITHEPTGKEICKGTFKSCKEQLFRGTALAYSPQDAIRIAGSATYSSCK
jgi:hypothetical protein